MNTASALTITLLLAITLPAFAGSESCPVGATTTQSAVATVTAEPRWTTPLLDALTASPPQPELLQAALADVPATLQGDPLVARARLTLAALLMQAGKPEPARAQLRLITTDSGAALDAGLLMAESYSATDPQTALQWNLRVMRRWPEEPGALDALAQQAAVLPGDQRAVAIGVLQETQQRAMQAIDNLLTLRNQLQEQEWFAGWLATGGTPALAGPLLPVFYRTVASPTFATARGAALATAAPALCAREQQARLAMLRDDIDRAALEAQQAAAVVEARHAAGRRAFLRKQSRYLADSSLSPGAPDLALGREVNRLRNAVARDEAEIAALRSAIAGLPAARARLDARAQQLDARSSTINRQASDDVLAALRSTIDLRITTLRDIAGSSARHLGELQDPRYRAVR